MVFRMCSAAAVFVCISAPGFAEEEEMCEAKGTNGMVSMLLCPEGLSQDELRAAGAAVCEGRMPCGAWIWEDAAVIPEEAPERHDLLPPESVRAAKAIWVNETNELMLLEKN